MARPSNDWGSVVFGTAVSCDLSTARSVLPGRLTPALAIPGWNTGIAGRVSPPHGRSAILHYRLRLAPVQLLRKSACGGHRCNIFCPLGWDSPHRLKSHPEPSQGLWEHSAWQHTPATCGRRLRRPCTPVRSPRRAAACGPARSRPPDPTPGRLTPSGAASSQQRPAGYPSDRSPSA